MKQRFARALHLIRLSCRTITTRQVEAAATRLSTNQVRKVEFVAQKFFELTSNEQGYVFRYLEQSQKNFDVELGFIEYIRNLVDMLSESELSSPFGGVPRSEEGTAGLDR